MSIFESIKNAIFGHGSAPAAAGTPAPQGSSPAGGASSPPGRPSAAAAPSAAISAGSLEAQLTQLNAKSAQKLNWQTSIVDLMKLVGLDPSLANRKQLAQELGYKGDTADSASMNIWLHKEVMDKLAQSGGKVTPDLKA
jgi:uncharacterized protein DUF3597